MKNTVNYAGECFKKVIVNSSKEVTERCNNCCFNNGNGSCTAPKICKGCEGDHKNGFYWENAGKKK